jgi:hypothetical protein
MRFQPSQRVALESLKVLAEQKDQLKEINSKRFFTEFGEALAPRLNMAFNSTVQPMIERLGDAIARMETKSREGFEQPTADVNLPQLAQTLERVQRSLAEAQINLAGSSADFQQSVTQAANKMLRAVEQAEGRLGSCDGSTANNAEPAMAADVGKPQPRTNASEPRLSRLLGALPQHAAGTFSRVQQPTATAVRHATDEAALISIAITPEALETMPHLRHWLDLCRLDSYR